MTIESLTYKELADRLGCKVDSARKMVQRKRWNRTTGNDGQVRIQVPMADLPAQDATRDSPKDSPQDKLVPELLLKALEGQIDGLKELVEAERKRADTEALRAEAEARRADAEGNRAGAAEADRDAWREIAQAKLLQASNDAEQKPPQGFLKRLFG